MAQTIVQVAGRAGRAEKPGEVVIQTRHIEHPALSRLIACSYEEYALEILKERAQSHMPPFAHLALLRIESRFADRGFKCANQFFTSAQEIVRTNGKVELIGPLPAPMEKRAGRHRFQIHVKSDSRPALQHFLQNFVAQIEGAKLPAQTRWALDVDPQDLI